MKYKLEMNGNAKEESIVSGDKYRFTVLTSGLLRMEYSEDGVFEDLPTQIVVNRNFETPEYIVIDRNESLEIITDRFHLTYNKQVFSKHGLNIKLKSSYASHHNNTYYYSESQKDLKGTARTLDGADGDVPLEAGIMSRMGYTLIDDSHSLVLTEDGWIKPRKKNIIDLYFFGYPREYKKCIQDFFQLCGKTPLIPRYALGNWWSRYYAYSDKEYLELIKHFKEEQIPFSVAVIDMDWHITDVEPKYGHGWTGYTWNKELFPNPKEFMDELHNRGLKITLNVHPADGVRPYEEMYDEMANALGVGHQDEQPIPFFFRSIF